ncbi:MAG: ATP12 family protein [Pseudomonadota bacterium]
MKRFYSQVTPRALEAGWQVMLDERGIKTVKGAGQIVPTEALAQILAREWEDQGDTIDPALLVGRDMADYAIDILSAQLPQSVDKLLAYAETDTLCYRADPEDALYKRQQDEWEPLLSAFERREGVKLARVSGVLHAPQPPDALEALRTRLAHENAFALAGLETVTSLAASLVCALSACEPDGDPAAVWRAASLEEEWQAELWGRDEEAEARRARRSADFLRAVEFVKAARG